MLLLAWEFDKSRQFGKGQNLVINEPHRYIRQTTVSSVSISKVEKFLSKGKNDSDIAAKIGVRVNSLKITKRIYTFLKSVCKVPQQLSFDQR